METIDIDKAIDVLDTCYRYLVDQMIYDGENISDADAIKQTIKCLKGYKESLVNKEEGLRRMRTETEIRNAMEKIAKVGTYWAKGSVKYNKNKLILNILRWVLNEKQSIY